MNLCKMLQPTDVKSSRSFLGLATLFRRSVQEILSLAALLTSLLCKKVPWNWASECDVPFRGLKAKLISAPDLATPNFDQHFEVWCDASGLGIGTVALRNCPSLCF